MTNDTLNVLQFLSICLSGLLGLLGVLFNFKDKESGRLTRWGKIAFASICLSFLVGFSSKYVEVRLRRMAEESEAVKTRVAAEQTLKIVTNVERVANEIRDVDVSIGLSLSLDSPLMAPFKKAIHSRLGKGMNDQELKRQAFLKLIPGKGWQELAMALIRPEIVILLFPKGTELPRCLSAFDKNASIRFVIKFDPDSVEYPQFGEFFEVKTEKRVDASPTKRPQVMSLIDFNNATAFIYAWVPVMETNSAPIESPERSGATNDSDFAKRFPVTAWNLNNLEFKFDGNRHAYLTDVKKTSDPCTGHPYYMGTVGSLHK